MRLHDLRHTAATLLLQQGIHPRVVQEMLGHSSLALTLQVYSHGMSTMQREADDRLDSVLANSPSRANDSWGRGHEARGT
jgi:integrase